MKTLSMALAITAGALLLEAPSEAMAAPLKGHGATWETSPSKGRKSVSLGKTTSRTKQGWTGENGYLGLNDMLIDPQGRPDSGRQGHRGKKRGPTPATVLPVPLPASLPLLVGGLALIGTIRHRRKTRGHDV
ncbi:VPLPA-CTERM sorting domain-containing protein [Amaricoccus tamworthensis]|uniref:VPLPA-CTERM sorting domain-containing protein n=1 Tax=Amaricoccus tamworthensis TaxID=57002 RepID=UPI003C7D9FB6